MDDLHPKSRTSRIAAAALLVMACATAAIGIGGVHRETIASVAVMALLALGLSSWKAPKIATDGVTWLLVGLGAVTALQLLPLPFAWVASLAPPTAATAESAARALGQATPEWLPLTLDPQQTTLMLMWSVAVLAAYIAAHRLAKRQSRGAALLLAIPIIGVVVVLIGLAHGAVGTQKLFGVYTPVVREYTRFSTSMVLTTFLNPNHLAAFLNLGAPIALGQAATPGISVRQRFLWLVAFLLLGAGLGLTASRAGILTGGAAVVFMLLSQGGPGIRVTGAIAAVVGLLVVAAGPLPGELGKLATSAGVVDLTDRGMHQLGLEVVGRWPWAGVGRGAFGLAHTQVNDGITRFTVSNPHNVLLQLVCDYGLVVGGAALLLGAALLVAPLRRALQNPLHRGAAAGLCAVIVHNMVDFSLDLLGVALAATVVVGVLRSPFRGLRLPTWAVLGGAAALLGLVLWLARTTGPEAGPRRDETIVTGPLAAAVRSPADAHAFLAAGIDQRSEPLLRHALFLGPGDPAIAVALATLVPQHEALPLLRRAIDLPGAYRVLNAAFSLLRRRSSTADDLLSGLPERGAIVASYLAWAKPVPESLVRLALKRFPEDEAVLEQVCVLRLAQKRLRELDDLATRLMVLGHKSGYRYLGKVFALKGERMQAYHMLLEAGDAESQLDAAAEALAAEDFEKALYALDTAEVPAKLFARMQLLRTKAEELRAARLLMGVGGAAPVPAPR